MEEFRIRPMSDYMQTASWDQVYSLTEHWLSDLLFFKDEINFLRDLFSKYFMLMADDNGIDSVKGKVVAITQLEQQHKSLNEQVISHLKHIDELLENEFSHDAQSFRDEHAKLETALVVFVKNYRKIKQDLFEITEGAIANRKWKTPLNP